MPKRLSENSLVIIDQKLIRVSPQLKKWLKSFIVYPVSAGENLKNLDQLPKHLKKILQITKEVSPRDLTIVAVGGGSVGDFAGFVASIFKRGVNFVQIPSTWLSAVDSAHGGKTALNVSGGKNQIGSFYPAEQVFIVRELLQKQPKQLMYDAWSELYKIALLEGSSLYKKVLKIKNVSEKEIWSLLPIAVKAKYLVVEQDPYEKKEIRYQLNFGHTIGHVFESLCSVSHGQAISLGLQLELKLSLKKGTISEKIYNEITGSVAYQFLVMNSRLKKPLLPAQVSSLLMLDKKRSGKASLKIVFLQKPGKFKIKSILISDLVKFLKSEGFVR